MAQHKSITTAIHDDRDNLENWWPQTPEEEFQDGFASGRQDAIGHLTRAEFLDAADALAQGTAAFFQRLRSMAFLGDEPAANGSIEGFEHLMFGPYGDGIRGPYAAGYTHAFETLRPFVRSLH